MPLDLIDHIICDVLSSCEPGVTWLLQARQLALIHRLWMVSVLQPKIIYTSSFKSYDRASYTVIYMIPSTFLALIACLRSKLPCSLHLCGL